MTTPADTTPLPATYPADTWLRSIEFCDLSPDTGTDVPVHVAAGCTVNGGRRAPFTLLAQEIVVASTPNDGTMVSFTVPADDVAWDHPGQDGSRPTMLGGLRIVGPPEPEWQVEPADYFEHLLRHGKDKGGMTVVGGEVATCRVVVYVRSLAFTCQT